MAAQKPSTTAATAHCSGQGSALRTFMRGELMVSLRLSNLKRIWMRMLPKDTCDDKSGLVRLCVGRRPAGAGAGKKTKPGRAGLCRDSNCAG